MTQPPRQQDPAVYRLRVAGHLDHHWSPWFGDLALTHEDDGTTSLTGVVCDQAELHGLLTKIRDLGVTLISLGVVDSQPTLVTPPAGCAGVIDLIGAGESADANLAVDEHESPDEPHHATHGDEQTHQGRCVG
jgi:hypothetical protein